MLAIIAVILGLLGMGGTIFYVNEHFFASANNQYEMQETHQRLVETATRLQANFRYYTDNGQAYLLQPAPVTGTTPFIYSQVPSWINSNARNAAGVPFLYCPYANYSGPSSTGSGQFQQPTDSSAITTSIINNAMTGSRNYLLSSSTAALPATLAVSTSNWANSTAYAISAQVYDAVTQQYFSALKGHTSAASGTFAADRLAHPDYWTVQTYTSPPLGLLVAAAPGRGQPPNCSDVVLGRNSYPTVPGGIVLPIANNDYATRMQAPNAPGIPTLYVGASASGDGSGRGPNDQITLDNALTAITTLQPSTARLNLGSGTFTPTIAIPENTALYFAGNGSGNTTLSFASLSSAWLIKEFSKYVLANLTVSNMNNLEIRGELQTTDVMNLNNLHINGGRVLSSNSSNASASINNAITIDGDGTLITNNAPAITITTDGGVNVNVGSWIELSANPAVITGTANTAPVFIGAGGRIVKESGTININAASGTLTGGMRIYPGGTLRSDLQVTDASDYGVLDEGKFISASTGGKAISFSGTAPTYGIKLANGGIFTALNGSVGDSTNRPTYAIGDFGGSALQTAGSNIYASTACWIARSGTNLFSSSLNSSGQSYAGGSSASYTQNFDSLSAGTLPAGWHNAHSGDFQVTTANSFSGPNSITDAHGTDGDAVIFDNIPSLPATADVTMRYDETVSVSGGTTSNYGPIFRANSNFTQGYAIAFNGGSIYFLVSNAGSFYSAANMPGPNFNDGDRISVRSSVIGSTLSIKIWLYGTAEPGSWTAQYTDNTISGPGYAGLYASEYPGSGVSFRSVDNLIVSRPNNYDFLRNRNVDSSGVATCTVVP